MIVAFDLDGCIDAYPREMQSLMQSLRAAGHHVEVVTGVESSEATETTLEEKATYLASLGCGECYDRLVVVAYDPTSLEVAANKVAYLQSIGCHTLVDNTKANAQAATEAGILALVPWGARQ